MEFAGIITPGRPPEDPAGIVRNLAARDHQITMERGADALFVQAIQRQGGRRAFRPELSEAAALWIAEARIDNRDELRSALGIDRSRLKQMSDAMLVRHAFETAGDDGIAAIAGQFAFARWDAQTRRLVLARDCLGHVPLFYHARPGFIAFATSLNLLLSLPGVPREIDEVLLGHTLALNAHEPRRTLYCGVERVPSRTVLTLDSDGIRHRHYWSPDLNAHPYRRAEDYVERARELLDQAVASAMRETPRAALLLSGGLDSSAIAATCARLGLAGNLNCYTGLPASDTAVEHGPSWYGDERGKVDALRNLHPQLQVHYVRPRGPHPFDEDAARYFPRFNGPIRNVANMGWFAGLCDAIDPACHVHLTGDSGNFGLSWEGWFSLVELLRSGSMRSFAHELAATAKQSGRGIGRTFFDEVVKRAMPESAARSIHHLKGRNPYDIARYSLLNPAFIAAQNLTGTWREQGYDPYYAARGTSGAAYRAYHLFDANQRARDRRLLSLNAFGERIRAPLADRRLLEFCLSVPEPMYRENGVPRSFARRVLADRLPAEILGERRRGAQAPNWFRTLEARRPSIAREIESFENSPLARRLLDLPRMKRLMAEWPADEHAAEKRKREYRYGLARGVHMGQFIRWIERSNA